ncbi:MAG: HlyC/CorC family transporter, partial [Bacteroidales bacterium]|nr:HlyC/CorC family transporter [Bacteroidales bacterium]
GLFSMSEVSLINSRKSSLQVDAKRGSKTAKTVLDLIENPTNFLSTVQIGITLVGILTGMFSGASVAVDLAEVMQGWGMKSSVAAPLSQVIIVVVVTLLTIILGELVPKKIGMSSSEKIAKVISGPMVLLSWLTKPFVWFLSKTTDGIVKVLGIREQEANVTEEEIKSMIAEGAEDGEEQEVEQDIVERVFSLGDRTIDSIMTNRSDIVWIDSEMTNEEINSTVKENLFQVYPVGEGSLDEIIGVVFLKDLFGKLDDKDFNISQILKPAQYFYENMEVFKVLEDMKEKHIGYGLICDEFGICQGIVTHKDILEGLVGAINNPEEEPFIIERKSEDGGWLVDGQCPFYDFLAHFEKEEHENSEEEFDFNTIGGLILELLEHIPQSGERVSWKEFDFEVLDMDGARIDKILVKLRDEQGDQDTKYSEEE